MSISITILTQVGPGVIDFPVVIVFAEKYVFACVHVEVGV